MKENLILMQTRSTSNSLEKICGCCQRSFKEPSDYFKNTTRWRKSSNNWLWFNCSCGSTLVLKEQKYEWFDTIKLMGTKAKKAFSLLDLEQKIPDFPEMTENIFNLLSDENSSPELIVEMVRKNPILFGKINAHLKNLSTLRGYDYTSLKNAIVYFGRNKLKDFIGLLSLQQFLWKSTYFHQNQYWLESFLGGKIAEELAKTYLPKENFDDIYLAGCLSNIGKLLLATVLPQQIDSVYRLVIDKGVPWIEAENKLGFHTHDAFGEIATVMWAFPEFITDANQHHNDLYFLDSIEKKHCIIFSIQLIHLVLDQDYRVEHKILNNCLNLFKINPQELIKIVKKFSPLKNEVKKMVQNLI